MDRQQADRVAWATFEDTIRRMRPNLDVEALVAVLFDLREAAPGAVWGVVPDELVTRRDLLRLDVVEAAEALLGGRWPIVGDAPECPTDAAELFNGET